MKLIKQLTDYFELTKSQFRETTIEHHRQLLKNIINSLDHIKVDKLDKMDLEYGLKFIAYLKDFTKCSNNTINRHIRYLKNILKYYKIFTSLEDLKLLPSDTKPFKRFYHDEIKLIIDYLNKLNYTSNSVVYRSLVRFLLDSGVRISEALAIRITNIDFVNQSIYLEETKTKKVRYAPFSDFSANNLKEIIALKPQREYLFYNILKDRPLSKNDVKLFYRRLKKALHIDRIHTHRFRKTFGSMLVENGLPIEHLQSIYQHSRITTTMKYVQYEETKALEEYKKFNKWKI